MTESSWIHYRGTEGLEIIWHMLITWEKNELDV